MNINNNKGHESTLQNTKYHILVRWRCCYPPQLGQIAQVLSSGCLPAWSGTGTTCHLMSSFCLMTSYKVYSVVIVHYKRTNMFIITHSNWDLTIVKLAMCLIPDLLCKCFHNYIEPYFFFNHKWAPTMQNVRQLFPVLKNIWRHWRGCGEKGTLLHCWWERKLIQPLWRTVWRFLKKLKLELPYDPAIPLLDIYPEKTIIQKESWGLPWWRSG